jgi:hypothetical protein
VTMDFITGLPRSEGKDVLLVVVDKLKLIKPLLTPALKI